MERGHPLASARRMEELSDMWGPQDAATLEAASLRYFCAFFRLTGTKQKTEKETIQA